MCTKFNKLLTFSFHKPYNLYSNFTNTDNIEDEIPLIEIQDFVIGDQECSYANVLNVLNPGESDSLVTKWKDVARLLNVPNETIHKLNRNHRFDESSMWEIYYNMLVEWRMKKSNEATILALVKILEDVGISDKADNLRDAFLPSNYTPIKKQEKSYKPCDRIALCLLSALSLLWISSVLFVNIPLWGRSAPEYLNTIPNIPNYYVPRAIIQRNKISLSIFQEDLTNDVLVFQGITRARIKMLTKDGLVDTFENQMNEDLVTADFITNLNKISDFCDISRINGNKSLHFFIYDINFDSLYWVQSVGNLTLIQTHLTKHDELSEEYLIGFYHNIQLVPQVHSNLNKLCLSGNYSQRFLKPIIISGESGSGKSLFLASLGSHINKFSNDLTSFIISCPQLVDDIKNLEKFGANLKDRIIYAVSNQTCRNRKCTADLLLKFQSNSTTFVLLIDDFDQLDESQSKAAKIILSEVNQNWINSQIVISTAPNLLTDLEQTLGTIGHKIKPLSFSNQFDILVRFWLDKISNGNIKRLKYFTKSCLNFIKIELEDNATSKQIGGLAIQTMLIANVYQTHALKYADSSNIVDEKSDPVFKPISIIQLYMEMIDEKIILYANNKNVSTDLLWRAHSIQALKITFPNLIIPHNLLNTSTQQLINIGLVTTTKYKGLKFVHKTIPHYFVAWWILNFNKTHDLYSDVIATAFETTASQVPFNILGNQNTLRSTKFEYENIVYFLNLMLKIPNHKNNELKVSIVNQQDAALAAVEGNFDCILHSILLSDKRMSNIITDDLLITAVIHSDNQIVEFLIQYYQTTTTSVNISNVVVPKSKDPPIHLLHLAVIRGDYQIFSTVHSTVEINLTGQSLLHACLGFEFASKSSIVSEKKEIIETLVSQSRALLKERVDMYNIHGTPILNCKYPKLLIFLLELGADAFDIAKYDNVNILHVAARNYDSTQFYYIVREMFQRNYLHEILLNAKDIVNETPLQKHVSNSEPLEKTLEIFYRAGANFNVTNSYNDTILSTAIRNRHSVSCIKLIMGYNVTRNSHSLPEKSLIRLAILESHLLAVSFLISEGFNVNEKDSEDLLTPLYIAAKNDWHGSKTDVVEVLLKAKANPNTVNGPGNETALHVCAKDGWISTLRILIRYGADPFMEDSMGNTALHFALIREKWIDVGIPDEFEIVNYLIEEKQLDVNLKNKNEQTALEQALKVGKDCKAFLHLRTYKLLADNGAIYDNNLATAVLERMIGLDCSPTEYHLSDEEYNEALDKMVRLGGDVMRVNQQGMTFIHQAVRNKCIKGLKYLMEKGVDFLKKDEMGKSAMDYALKIINSEIRNKIVNVLESFLS